MTNRYRVKTLDLQVAEAAVQLAADIVRHTGKRIEKHDTVMILDVCAQANRLTRISLDECNGVPAKNPEYQGQMVWGDAEQKLADEARARAIHHIEQSRKVLLPKWKAEYQGDPRGCPVKFRLVQSAVEITIDAGE